MQLICKLRGIMNIEETIKKKTKEMNIQEADLDK